MEERFEASFCPEAITGCWLWTKHLNTPNGYGRLKIGGKRGRHVLAHIISWRIHKGEAPTGLLVLHKCDTRCCVNPDHLFLGTNQTNMSDMVAKNRANRPIGERNPRAKLSRDTVFELRRRYSSGEPLARLYAEHRDLTEGAVWRAATGRSWRQVY